MNRHVLDYITDAQRAEYPTPTLADSTGEIITDEIITLEQLRRRITVNVPPLPDAASGDRGHVTIQSKYGAVGKSFTIDDPLAEVAFHFEPQDLSQLGGSGDVYYIILDGHPGVSEARSCHFQERIPTPQIKGYQDSRSDTYTLPSEAVDNGLFIEIYPYENMEVGDTVSLFASATSEECGAWISRTIEQSDLSKILKIEYDKQKLKQLRPGALIVNYTISKDRIHCSRPININVLPLLPDPEPEHQMENMSGKYFLLIMDHENGNFYAPVVQHFSSEPANPGDDLLLLINSTYPHSYSYPLKIETQTSTVTFKIPEADLLSLSGQRINMATLWRRGGSHLVASQGQEWIVAAPAKKTKISKVSEKKRVDRA